MHPHHYVRSSMKAVGCFVDMKPARIIPVVLSVVSLGASSVLSKTNMMAFMPVDTQFQTVLEGIRAELDTSYNINVVDMSTPVVIEELADRCRKGNVAAITGKGLVWNSKVKSSPGPLPKAFPVWSVISALTVTRYQVPALSTESFISPV